MCRKWFYLMFHVLVLALATGASADLAAIWTFDEGSGTVAADSSGNGHDIDAFNGTPVWTEGNYGGALEFGEDDYVEATGYAGITGTDPRTCTAWIKTSTAGQQTIMTWGLNVADQKWRIRIEASNNSLRVENNGGNHWGTTDLADGEWHHTAVTFEDDGTPDIRDSLLYVDGQLEAIDGGADQPVNTNVGGTVRIGLGPWAAGRSFNGLIDDVRIYDHALSADEILGSMSELTKDIASEPIPDDEALDIPRDVILRWTSGEYSDTHNVFFGTILEDVNQASTTDPLGVTISPNQSDNTFDPGRLDFDQTYYWRVDEVNGAPDFTVFKGDVWHFSAEPFSIPITNITTTASSEFGDSVAGNTINGSGMIGDLHGVSTTDMWISAGIPATIEYAFDRAYKVHELWVWNSNQTIEPFIGFGAKGVVIEHSLDGENWTELDGVPELAQAGGIDGSPVNSIIDFGGATAQHVRVTINTVQGFAPQASLSEVRFFYIPTYATRPDPASGATDVAPDTALSWGRNGREVDHHEVYVGTDANDLASAGITGENSFSTDALDLLLGQTYSWRVDEVNDAMDPSTWASAIWSFTTADSITVDDMESYKDEEFFEIWATWIDGFDDPSNGSLVGNGNTGSPETDIVHGGDQSLPLHYDNIAAAQSEATRTFEVPQDWTGHGVTQLGINFQGAPANTTAQMYVQVNGTKVLYDGDASDLAQPWWQYWGVDLASLGIDLTNVTTLSIGFDRIGAVGATGRVLLDDLGLYRGAPAPAVGTFTMIEDFDSLAVGSNPHDLDGWEGWRGDRTQGSAVTNAVAYSGANALELVGGRDDLVATWSSIDAGIYLLTVMQYVPSATTAGLMWFRTVSAYGPAVNTSVGDIVSNCADGTVYVTQLPAATRPTAELLRDQWTKLTVVLDFDTNTSTYYYNAVYLGARACPSVMAVNIFPNGTVDTVYFDDFRFEPVP